MANDQLFYKAKTERYSRKTETREIRNRFLIVCEGRETEKNYFEAFPVSDIQLVIQGTGFNTDTLVRHAIDLKNEAKRDKKEFLQVWCVFDRDSFPTGDFNTAILRARQHNIKVAYSNEAFELWFLLHFDYHNTGVSRRQYGAMLSKRLGYRYDKADSPMYNELKDKQEKAIRNAKRLYQTFLPNHNPERDNPCTTVYQLVEEINKYLEEPK